MQRDRSGPAARWSRRGVARLLGGGLLTLAANHEVAASRQTAQRDKKKKPKFRTITRTFTNAAPILIFDQVEPGVTRGATPFPAEILVSGFKQGKLLDVNLKLSGVSHGRPEDIDTLLVAPNGRKALVMSDVGNTFPASNLTLTLNDQAAASLPTSSPLGSGAFRPTDFDFLGFGDQMPLPAPPGNPANVKLSTFIGINPNGTWRLFVGDDVSANTGGIAGGWSLTIRARVRK